MAAVILEPPGEHPPWAPRTPILTYWYFHLPNFILAALMYTLLGRAVLGLVVGTGFAELYLALLLPDHRSVRHARCGW